MLSNTVRLAWAVFRRRSFFTFVSLFGITLTLSVLLAATAVLDHAFGVQPPETRQALTVNVMRVSTTKAVDGRTAHWNGFAGLRLLETVLPDLPGAELAAVSSQPWKTLSYHGGRRIESYLRWTDSRLFDLMEYEFVAGRPLAADEVERATPVAVVNRSTARRFFGDGPAVGQRIDLEGRGFEVVGVVEDVSFMRQLSFADIWAPITCQADHGQSDELVGMYTGQILARDRQALPGIRAEVLRRVERLLEERPEYEKLVAVPETLLESVGRILSGSMDEPDATHASSVAIAVFVLLSILFMVLPALNLVNLNVSRILERSSEIGVRKAFGAPRSTLIAQFVVENTLLTLAGGLLALGVASLGLRALEASAILPYAEFRFSWRVFAWGLGWTLLFGLLSGILPAWRMARLHPVEALRGGAA